MDVPKINRIDFLTEMGPRIKLGHFILFCTMYIGLLYHHFICNKYLH